MRFSCFDELSAYRAALAAKGGNCRSLWVCGGPGCTASGSKDVYDALDKALRGLGADNAPARKLRLRYSGDDICEKFSVGLTGCMGPCEHGPVVYVEPEGWYYQKVTPEGAEEILLAAAEGRVCEKYCPRGGDGVRLANPTAEHIAFLAKQRKLILSEMKNNVPTDLDSYIRRGGFSALQKALAQMTPLAVCQEIDKSGLRGRGGGGFPTGRKWLSCLEAPAGKKYVLVNGDEGDPGAFMDRCLMEGDPFAVLEGLIIGGYAVGSDEGIIYVRHEYPLAVRSLEEAKAKLEASGLLGGNILGSEFSFRAEICKGGGAFVCGESTALMASIEGKPGTPRVKYIRSTERGIWESPTVLNNVETWANVPHVINMGFAEYKKTGTEKSPGTKIFALVGKVRDTGLVEVPMGVTLREIIFSIGGGIAKGGKFKAVQTGGPSGGCLPESMLDTPVDFDSLTSAGSMMGSGGMIVMDENTCMVDVARYFTDFLAEESCGKCVPCREGLKKMQTLLHDLTSGRARPGDTALLADTASVVAETALCGLGQSAANPVLSTIKYFPEEYAEHETERFCRAGVCVGMYLPQIVPEACKACGACERACPSGAVYRSAEGGYLINGVPCVTCGACVSACPFGAIKITRGIKQ